MAVIRRDFLPGDLLPCSIKPAWMRPSLCKRASLWKMRWLLELADEHDWIAGVVGWVPLADPRVDLTLEQLSANAKLKGVRHVLQGEPTNIWRGRFQCRSRIAVKAVSLSYDVLILEHQLPAAIQLVDRHPASLSSSIT
jgi:L-fuconolactonase